MKGLSIVELLIGIAILAVVSLMVGAVYLAHFRLFSRQSTGIEVSSQNRVALDEIVNQTREAESVRANCCSSPTLVTSSCSAIALRLWPLDANGDPTAPSDLANDTLYDHVAYYVDASKNLIKITDGAVGSNRPNYATKILATNLSAITPLPGCNSGLEIKYLDSLGADVTATPTNAAQVVVQLKTTGKYYGQTPVDVSQVQEAKAVLRNK